MSELSGKGLSIHFSFLNVRYLFILIG